MKKIKIIATVGPACKKEKMIGALIQAGADIFRINMSHQTPDSLKRWCRLIRRQKLLSGRRVAILTDLQGPRIRTGKLKNGKAITLMEKEKIAIKVGRGTGDSKTITTPFKPLLEMVREPHAIFIDNGLLELRVLKVLKQKDQVECRVVTGGSLGENKGINLPDAVFPSSGLTAKDKRDLRAAAQMKVDWIALSFVQSARDLQRLKCELEKLKQKIPVMAKIEKQEAVDQIQDILDHCEAVMVARGDLGIEAGLEQVPILQKKIIGYANNKKLPVVTATEMLESMIKKPRPTRAEVSDVANAILDGTDAVMLSGETAVGKYPVRAVKVMRQIIQVTQRYQKTR